MLAPPNVLPRYSIGTRIRLPLSRIKLARTLYTTNPTSTTSTTNTNTNSSPRGSTSHVRRGASFEKHSLGVLQENLGMDLIRIGGKGDEGVDLMGWWWLPDSTFRDGDHGQEAEEGPLAPDGWRRLRVFGQCKAEKRKAGPKYVREMEGVVYRHLEALSQNSHTDASRYPVIALLVSLSGFSIGAVRRANASSVPFFLLHISPQEDSSEDDASVHVLRDACWNLALQGVLQGKGEMRCERRIGENGEDLRISHLWWEGKRWEKNTHTAPKYR